MNISAADDRAAGRPGGPGGDIMRSAIRRHPVASFLVAAYLIFWASWMPVLFLDAPPRLFSAVGAVLGLALPAFLVTAATDGRPGVRDLLRRALRWRVSLGWYLLAALAVPAGALLLAPLFLGPAPLSGLLSNWSLLFTAFLPQLLLALVTVQFFEELGWSGLVQHRLQARRGALKASLLVALAFAFLHVPTYLRAPISAESLVRDLSVLVIVLPFAVAFRVLIAFAYNRTAYAVLIAAVTHASFNEASELIGPNLPGPLGQILAFASTGLLALLAVVLSRATLAYRRRSHPTEAGRDAPGRSRPAGGPISLSSADPAGHHGRAPLSQLARGRGLHGEPNELWRRHDRQDPHPEGRAERHLRCPRQADVPQDARPGGRAG